MATPALSITYLTGIQAVAPPPPVVPVPPPLPAQIALLTRVAPPLWHPLAYGAGQYCAPPVVIQVPPSLHGTTALKMTVFFRGSQALPLKGQRYPLSR